MYATEDDPEPFNGDPGVMAALNCRQFMSQQGEDLEVYVDYFKDREVKGGIYIEAGAVEGWQASNSWYFEHNEDFTGMLVEANPRLVRGLRMFRPNNILVIGALYDADNLQLTFRVPTNGEHVMLGYIEEHTTERQKATAAPHDPGTFKVPSVTLGSLVSKANYSYVDVLFLDIEGGELKALQGIDWSIPIYVIAIELPSSDDVQEDELKITEACRDILRERGYIFNKAVGCTELWHLPIYRDGKPTLLYDKSTP